MSNPFLARAKQFGLQGAGDAGRAREVSVDLPPPPVGYASSGAGCLPAPPKLAAVAEIQIQRSPAATPVLAVSSGFKPPPGSTGPPPAGGSKVSASSYGKPLIPMSVVPMAVIDDDDESPPPPPPPAAATPTAAAIPVAPVLTSFDLSPPSRAVAVTASTSPVPAPVSAKPFVAPSNPPLPTPPSSANVRTTLNPSSNVVGGVQRGAFGDHYSGNKPAAAAPAAAASWTPPGPPAAGVAEAMATLARITSPSALQSQSSPWAQQSQPPLPSPPVATAKVFTAPVAPVSPMAVPPPPPPADAVPPPPPAPIQDELTIALRDGLTLRPMKPINYLPLPTPPPVVAPKPNFGLRPVTKPPAFTAAASSTPVAPPAPASASAADKALFGSMTAGGFGPSGVNASHSSTFCAGCSRAIGGQVLELGDGRSFHPECYCCARCQQPVTTDIILVSNKPHHSACVMCTTCGVNLANASFAQHPTTGAIFCATHARNATPGASAAPTPSSGGFGARLVAGGQVCKGCGGGTSGSDSVIAAGDGLFFHRRCLRCATCQQQLDPSATVYTQAGAFYCQADYMKQFARACRGCSQPITSGSSMTIDTGNTSIGDKGTLNYHPGCFACWSCKLSLQNQDFFLKGTGLVCQRCT